MFLRIRHLADRKGTNRVMVRLRALLRSNEFYLIPLALVIGTLAGAIVTLMAEIAQIAHMVIYGIPVDVRLSANASVSPWAALIAPALGGLSLGIMEWWRRRLKLSSAVDPIEANALRGGNLSMRDSVVVSSQTLISNGCGASVGLEAGYTQIGSGIASLLGKFFNLRRNDLRLIVGCGAAAAIAAAFGAPITGAFYACELIVGVYSVGSAAPILAASLAGALTAQWLGGAPYSLEIPKVSAVGVEQYLALIGLALVTSGVGIAVMRSSSMFERLFKWLPVWLRPVIGGLIVGGFAIVTPQVLAAGHGAMVLDLFHDMTIGLIALIIALKVTACLISLASGFRGGLFFASLFVGSLIGKFFAAVLLLDQPELRDRSAGRDADGHGDARRRHRRRSLDHVVPRARDDPQRRRHRRGARRLHRHLDLRPLHVRHSFSTWRLHLRGETIRSANDVGWLRNLTVERLMRSDVGKVPSTTTIAAVRREFALGSRPGIVIVNNADEYVGLVLLPDLFSGDLDSIADEIQVIELARLTEIVLIPEMNVKSAMAVFDEAEAEMLAVVDSTDSRKVVGFLTETFVRRRYVEEIDKATRGVLGALS